MSSQYLSVDREAIWAALFTQLQKLTAASWAPSTAYSVGDVRTDPQGHLQKVTVAGTSGSAEPAWNDAGGTTTDGAVTWQDTGAGFVSVGRKHKAPPDLTAAEQPALFVVQAMEEHVPQRVPGAPTKLILHGFLILYLQAPAVDEAIGEEELLAATMMNALFNAIDNLLLPDDASGKFTLGGLATHCWLEGETRQDPGILGTQAAALLPVHILVP